MDYLTAKTIIDKEKKGMVVQIYPRKLMVCISGFKYYKISPATLARYEYYKKYNWLCS